ncbi:MAG: prephenate dehydratase [Paludibacteraceae bacterium]|nr:prephenate dehydratase [Candidatus Physcocola equi]MCQ2235099.1 prephenate dehydratase [Paludibacteraceae bacterium]
MKRQVAIQGVAGCFHDIAARAYFKNDEVETVPCNTFRQLFDSVKNDQQMIGIVAIENTIAGSLLQNHNLLRDSGLQIVGEHKLRIKQNLVALPGQKVDDIKEAYSHPIALMQCKEFLNEHSHIKAVESEDTALSAKLIAEEGESARGKAAICGELAAELYGLEVLAKSIETNKHNFTRFLIVTDRWNVEEMMMGRCPNKSSFVFTLTHEEGSLAKVLSILSYYGLNLTKIQSLPIMGREWEYQFYVDLKFSNYLKYKQGVDAIIPLTKDLIILGEYEEGEQTI